MSKLQAPFPWFGGKSKVADLVWSRLGDCKNYIEPFFGSGAILLGRPAEHTGRIETINDLDGYVANFWRAVKHDPEAVADYADNPVNECDLHARHTWLVNQRFVDKLMGDPDWFDAKIAGWWVWGTCAWIGSGFCSGKGPWQSVDGMLVKCDHGQGVNKKLPHFGNPGQGVNKKLPHFGNPGQGVNKKLPHIGDKGRGVNKGLPHIGGKHNGRGINKLTQMPRRQFILEWMQSLSVRLRDVRVACGDWSRVCNAAVRVSSPCAIVLDPPYGVADRAAVYSNESFDVSHAVRDYALKRGSEPGMRVALFGYEGEHEMPSSWECVAWKANGGYSSKESNGGLNAKRERIWFSPECLKPATGSLFDGET